MANIRESKYEKETLSNALKISLLPGHLLDGRKVKTLLQRARSQCLFHLITVIIFHKSLTRMKHLLIYKT